MIRLEDITLGYGEAHPVLQNIFCEIAPGSVHFLTGTSGAGKSTLLKLLDLSLRPLSGTFRLFGNGVDYHRPQKMSELRRRIGMVFQDFRLLDSLTVAENIALPLVIAGMKEAERRQRAIELLEWLGMEHLRDMYPPLLSGGQKQRVAVARSVIHQPDIILADEPTGNLDAAQGERLMSLFQALNSLHGTTLLIATHDETMVRRYAYPILHLTSGHLKRELSPSARLHATLESC